MNRTSLLAGLSIFLMLALSPFALAQSAKPQQLRLAVSTATPHNTPLWVAKDKKIFDKYGLDVQLIFVMGGALVTQMLAAGEIQIAANAPAALLGLVAGGEKIAMFIGISNTSPFTLISQSNIKAAADLKGKRLGTARFGGSSHVSALIALDYLKLDSKRDNVVLLQTGLDPERMKAATSPSSPPVSRCHARWPPPKPWQKKEYPRRLSIRGPWSRWTRRPFSPR